MRLDGIKSFNVISDTHGISQEKLQNLLPVFNEAELLVFLGDGLSDLDYLSDKLTCPLIKLRGNCDILKKADKLVMLELQNYKMLFTHGDSFGVKNGLDKLYYFALQEGCTHAFYGHTHIPDITVEKGVTLVNPGSLNNRIGQKSSFCTVFWDNGQYAIKIILI